MTYPQNTINLHGRRATFVWMKGINFYEFSPIAQVYGIIVNEKGEALIGRQVGSNWTLPGGKPEGNETPLETLTRELMEEVDVKVITAKELGLQKAYFEDDKRKIDYQARFVVTEFELMPPTPDPDGQVMWERKFVPINDMNKYLRWGTTGEALFKDAEEMR